VNNGVYYMDTTVPKDKQISLGAGNFTEFQASTSSQPRTYNMFFLFAKPTTTQTYKIYVGPGFDKDTDVKLIRADISVKKITFTSNDTLPATWSKEYKDGVLTVTVNMNFPNFITNYNAEREKSCQPSSFCTWTGTADTGSCGCNATLLDYPDQNLINECNGTNDNGLQDKVPLCSWSVSDVTCPKGGCYGFSFKMPDGFTTGTKEGLPPAAKCFPQMTGNVPSPWNTPFVPASKSLAGTCTYSQSPSPDFCP
jgi:cell migration-inducing and hyaluronan-binding protein